MGVVINIILFIIILLILFLLNFYRDPKRKIPKGNNIVSPADGKVIQIIKINQNKLKIKKGLIGKINTLSKDVGKDCYLVSIFMNVFNVHVNRAPIEGEIKKILYENGHFFNAGNFNKSLQNEKNEILFENKKIKIKIIQIAGFLARKIICKVKVNEKVNKGQRVGSIVLGSQVSLIIPSNVKLKVKIGDKVKAGTSIIAEY